MGESVGRRPLDSRVLHKRTGKIIDNYPAKSVPFTIGILVTIIALLMILGRRYLLFDELMYVIIFILFGIMIVLPVLVFFIIIKKDPGKKFSDKERNNLSEILWWLTLASTGIVCASAIIGQTILTVPFGIIFLILLISFIYKIKIQQKRRR